MSRNTGDRTRRQFVNETLAALGAGATVGLAGCSGSEDNAGDGSTPAGKEERPEDSPEEEEDAPEDTPTSGPEVEHVPTGQLAEEWLQDPSAEDSYPNIILFDSYSPSQMYGATGTTFEEMSSAETVYDRLEGLDPKDIPETFYQLIGLPTTIKVDQLPAGMNEEEMRGVLQGGAGYAKSGSVGDFDIYTRSGNLSAHAIGEGKLVSSLNMFVPENVVDSEAHQETLETALQRYNEGSLSEDLQALEDELGPLDTFGGVKNQNLEKLPAITGGEMVDAIEGQAERNQISGSQPNYGAVSVDVEEGRKYGAWIFENAERAEYVADALNGSIEVRGDWNNFDNNGRIMTADSQINLDQRLDSHHAQNDGFIAYPLL